MTEKRPKFNPLLNKGTTKVFFELVSGPKNPLGIAKEVGINPSGVIKQLKRLQEIRIVRLGKKEGKSQFYEIDWNTFAKVFLENTELGMAFKHCINELPKGMSPGKLKIILSKLEIGAPGFEEMHEMGTIRWVDFENLRKSKYFCKLIKEYYNEYRQRHRSRISTIMDTIDAFERMVMAFPSFRTKPPRSLEAKCPEWWNPTPKSEEETREFLDVLEKWRCFLVCTFLHGPKIPKMSSIFRGLVRRFHESLM